MTCNCSDNNSLSRLPWQFIMTDINDMYRDIVSKEYGNGNNDEIYELLVKSKISAIEINEPFFDNTLDIKYEDNFFGKVAKDLTNKLREILEIKYRVPQEYAENVYIRSVSAPTIVHPNNSHSNRVCINCGDTDWVCASCQNTQ